MLKIYRGPMQVKGGKSVNTDFNVLINGPLMYCTDI